MSVFASLLTGVLALAFTLSARAGGARVEGQAAAPKPAEPQDPDRPTLSLSELKGLRDNNIFSPPKPKRAEPRREERREERREDRRPEAPRAKPAVLTGILVDPASGAPRALFEDRNSDALRQFKEPKFLKAGDELGGFVIEFVSPEKVVVRKGETSRELKVGDPLPDPAPPPDGSAAAASVKDAPAEAPAKAEPKAEARPLDEGAKKDVLEELRRKNKKSRSYDEP
jgi:hypothetical protein